MIISDNDDSQQCAHKGNLGGVVLESEVFKMLQHTLEDEGVIDTVVISSWKDNTPTAKKEFDFLIVSLPLKAIIHIEVKRTLNNKARETATKQLNKGLYLISNKVPFQKENNWKYLQCISYCYMDLTEQKTNDFLESHPFFKSKGNLLGDWWKSLMNQTSEGCSSKNLEKCKEESSTYLSILKYLFHQMFIQEDVLTQGILLFFFI